MYKRIGCLLLVSLLFLSGCMNGSTYKDEDVAAIVRGEEVLIGDMRLLYPDEAIPEMIDGTVKAKLAEQEAKKMKIDVSEQVDEAIESYGVYPDDNDQSAEAESIRTFADPQAEKLGMEPAAYYQKYTQASAEMTAYIQAYVDMLLGKMEDDEFGIEEFNHHANEMLDQLVELNSDAIEIRVK